MHGVINNLVFISLKIGPTNTQALVTASKETGLEVNADKTKYMVMSRDQNAGRCHNIMIDNSSFGKVEQFRYLGATIRIKILFGKKSRAD